MRAVECAEIVALDVFNRADGGVTRTDDALSRVVTVIRKILPTLLSREHSGEVGAFQRRAVPLISVVAVGAAIAAVPILGAPSSKVNNNLAICPRGMVSNPVGYGYGCGPDLAPGGAFVGAPSQEVLTRCGGNYYICVWPYPVP